jgi:hypothetical protein
MILQSSTASQGCRRTEDGRNVHEVQNHQDGHHNQNPQEQSCTATSAESIATNMTGMTCLHQFLLRSANLFQYERSCRVRKRRLAFFLQVYGEPV